MHSLLAKAKELHDNGLNHQVVALLGELSGKACMPTEEEAMFRCYVGSAAWKIEQMLLANSQFLKAYRMLPFVTNSEYACWIEICESVRLGNLGAHAESESMLALAYFKYTMSDAQRAHILRLWGQQARVIRHYDHAEDLLRRSIDLYEALGDRGERTVTVTWLAESYVQSERYLAAITVLDDADGDISALSSRTLSNYWRVRAEALLGLGEQSSAEGAAEVAFAVAVGTNLPTVLARTCFTVARVFQVSDPDRSKEFALLTRKYGLSARNGALVESAMGML